METAMLDGKMVLRTELPTPDEGKVWGMKASPKYAGAVGAYTDMGLSQNEAEERALSKYPPVWVQGKEGSMDDKIGEALGKLGDVLAIMEGLGVANAPPKITPALKALGLEKVWVKGPHHYKSGDKKGQVQYSPLYSEEDRKAGRIPDGKKVGDPTPKAKEVLRWHPSDAEYSPDAQIEALRAGLTIEAKAFQ